MTIKDIDDLIKRLGCLEPCEVNISSSASTKEIETYHTGFSDCKHAIKIVLMDIKDKVCKEQMRNVPIEDCDFSVRAYNCLKWAGINTLGNIKSVEQLIKVRNLGRTCCQEVIDKLQEYGIEIPEEEFEKED